MQNKRMCELDNTKQLVPVNIHWLNIWVSKKYKLLVNKAEMVVAEYFGYFSVVKGEGLKSLSREQLRTNYANWDQKTTRYKLNVTWISPGLILDE